MHTSDILPSTVIFSVMGLEKEPVFEQKVCASDSASAAVLRYVILSNAALKAFNI
jgi:hypothetical protein